MNTMNIEINHIIIRNIFSTNINELTEFIDYRYIIYLIIVSILLIVVNYFIILKTKTYKLKHYFSIIISIIILFFISTKINYSYYKQFIKYDTPKVAPFNVIVGLLKYNKEKIKERKIQKIDLSSKFIFQKHQEPLIVIVIIGESARNDRFGINGYSKDTTPQLKNISNLVSIQNVKSCDTSTSSSVPCLLTKTKQKDFKHPSDQYSFVKIFKDHGFDTTWIDLQNEGITISSFCKESNNCLKPKNTYDTDSLPIIKKILQSSKKDTLIVVHTMGSHKDYNNRYPKNLSYYKPLCNKAYEDCSYNELSNSYDNSIRFTDSFLSSIIGEIKNKNALLLYTSDHGESLGEASGGIIKNYGHAAPYYIAPKEQTNVPLILWFSDKYINTKNINKTNNYQNISHDNIFSTVLGCSGFESIYMENDLNLCKKIFK